jgi:hypothetical protein
MSENTTAPTTDQPPGFDTGTLPPRPPWWRRKLVVIPAGGLALLLAASIGAAAAGGGRHPAAKPAPPPSTSAPANPAPAPGLTSADIRSDLATVLNDLKQSDAAEQEAWVTGGHEQDLQALIDDTQAASGTDTLNTDAQTFNADASAYLAANDPYLAPGWTHDYHQVRADINALAVDCGLAPVPAPAGTS